jgi:uncharacterized oxidoreductase
MDDFRGGNGVLFLALAIEAFRPLEGFFADAAELCTLVKEIPPAPGFDAVLLPGEPEQRASARQQAEGLLVDEITWSQLTTAAAELGVDAPA